MRNDGRAEFYLVQHLDNHGEWVSSDLGHFLFKDLSYPERRGSIGDVYRALLSHTGASTDLWQEYGLDGFEYSALAEPVLREVRARNPDTKFRLVRRVTTQDTEVVA